MKNIRNLCFFSVLIAFIGWCMYFYLQEITTKLLVHPHLYTFTILEMLLAAMGAFLHSHYGCYVDRLSFHNGGEKIKV